VKPVFLAKPERFRAWLEKNHRTKKELLVGFHKRATRKASMTWSESVDEALCFGWIDGVRKSLGDDAYTIRFTPRKARSIWSTVNVARVRALEKRGKMTAAGLEAFAARTPERTGVYSFERKEAATLAAEEAKLLRANAKAHTFFESQAAWYRRAAIHWVISANRAETRERRLRQLVTDSASGRTVPPLTRRERA
jgi:uncharacterized protein YdeI (YjbR/CyaY-like superfamily)